VVAAIDVTLAAYRTAVEIEANASAAVKAEEAKSDLAVGALRDEMWNMLGRPRQSPAFDHVFPEGVATYTGSEVRMKPVFLQVLISRVQATSTPLFTKEVKDGWVADIEARRKSYQDALDVQRPAEAAATVARFAYRGAVRTALGRLRHFKRDLQNLGLTEAGIHEIIPDATRPTESDGPTPPTVSNLPAVRAA